MGTFLAIDIGAESGRAVAASYDGDLVSLEEVHRFPNGPVQASGMMYWDVLRIWSELKTSLSSAHKKGHSDLSSIGVDTWGCDFALLDGDDELVCNPRHYRDPRTEGMLEEAFARVPREEIYRRTGVQFMRLNTLYQLLAMAVHRSSQLHAARSLLMMPDLFNLWLCGRKVCEFTDATTTQFFNPSKNDWDRELLSKLRIPDHFLLEIVQPGTSLGPVDRAIQAELNLGRSGTEVVATSSHDTACAVAACPIRSENDAYISSGTWSLVGAEVRRPVITEATLALNFTNEGGVFNTFRLLRNIQGLWLLQECRRIWSKSGREYTYDHLTEIAGKARLLGFIIDVDDSRFTVPSDMPSAIARYCSQTGQGYPRSDEEITRCIFDSLALKYDMVTANLERILGRPVDRLHLVGGGSRNVLLNQLVSDATGKTVIAGPAEATSVGNALVQCVAAGLIRSSSELRSVVRKSFDLKTYEPDREHASLWEEAKHKLLGFGSRGFVG